jgi:hypothetical protein
MRTVKSLPIETKARLGRPIRAIGRNAFQVFERLAGYEE